MKEKSIVYQILHLIGEAHDKIIEAQDLVEPGEDEFPTELCDVLDDLEAELSEWDMMGEDDPEAAFYEKLDDADYPDYM